MNASRKVRVRQRLGKYRIEKRLAQGGFAEVFQAYDTIEGIRVALKVPLPHLITPQLIEDFKKEVRLTAKLDHRHVLKVKNAAFIDDHFVIVHALGDEALADRLKRRISLRLAMDFAGQLLEALAHAHSHRILHLDVKPENAILFRGSHLRLSDFGLARLTMRTIQASGSGTLGYCAPEQAMGRPSTRSDVFSAGLVLYRMFSGSLPEWPYAWPPRGHERLRRKAHPALLEFLRHSIDVDPMRRFKDAGAMLDALRSIEARVLRHARSGRTKSSPKSERKVDWRKLKTRQFQREYKKLLRTEHACAKCKGPLSEAMLACPWCGNARRKHQGSVRYPSQCKRCLRGVKLDWKFCPWCYGKGIGPQSDREFTDIRYDGRCSNRSCKRKDLIPFMRYCPWCHTKVKKPWKIEGHRETCVSCKNGVLLDYWSHCPWCARNLDRRGARNSRHGRGTK